MAITRQVITSLHEGVDILGTKRLAVMIADESIVSGSLLTVESNHFCVLKSRGAVLNVYETGQYALATPDKPLLGSIAQGFFGGNSPWVYEVIYVNRSKLLVRSEGIATSEEMAEMAYQVDYYIHVDSKQAALDLITHMPFNGPFIDVKEVADYAGPAIEQSINQVVQVTKMEEINEHINEVRELVKGHLTDFLEDLRHYAQRSQDPDHAQGRAHAGADLAAGNGADADRGGALLPGAEDGGEGTGFGSQCGSRLALQHWRAGDGGLFAGRRYRVDRRKVVASDGFYDAGLLRQIATNLFYGWGYNFYRAENQLRADDQLVRSQAAGLLSQAMAAVDAAESAYRREHLPPPSRSKPFPDAEAVAAAQGLERLARAIGALSAAIQHQAAPENDRMTQRYPRRGGDAARR